MGIGIGVSKNGLLYTIPSSFENPQVREPVLFVANHTFDCVGAKAAGMHTTFIDRRQRPFGITPYQPDIRVRSMTELADLLS